MQKSPLVMQAAYIENFGDTDQIKIGKLSLPPLNSNEVRIKVAYAGVNPVDWKICEGLLKDHLPHHFPLILGWDAAGTVDEVGSEVTTFKKNDKVFAYCRKPTVQWGTFAEYICVDTTHVAFSPENLTFAEAAAIPLAGLTAWQVLFNKMHLQKGQTLLIQAGAGGVGSLAIQFAKLAGVTVITTASEANHDYLQSLGADHIINYREENLLTEIEKIAPQKLDAVFDTLGGLSLKESYLFLKKNGKLVSIVEPPSKDLDQKYHVQGFYHFVEPNGQELQKISDLFKDKKMQPIPVQEMAMEKVAEALEINQKGHVRGKIVLKAF